VAYYVKRPVPVDKIEKLGRDGTHSGSLSSPNNRRVTSGDRTREEA
jgi:hypothetical protein